ncbi:MFS transporter (plasmid) [Agrobacterium rosae]|uniref:MFS transporter n=1 Tax=Agrobacterium rosae TaxID=1972867 RepID=A0AAE5RUA6_9HYPH|nr:MFS transporter [Agrobacterium rosae]KAA3509116.1 MFS transporter [Agrobacterium rosae]KAA3513811.1 MFS transporter [Agrobacterium rosae]MCM2435715.1 MFS transporter [Agrobacterium rosae]MDX8316477.1 MFS transporter [Agrobacterium rosae]MDX8332468.1 MFS transporter [Agrobacterium rosae]
MSLIRLLSRGQFAVYTAGNCISLVGTWMQRIACSLVVWDMTQSAAWLGVLAAADLLPTIVVGPLGGAAADRWNVLKLNQLCQFILAVIATLVAALIYFDLLSLWTLIGAILFQGCIIALGQPARMTIVQELVSRDDVPRAVAINSMNVNLARLIGPALAGLLIVQFDVVWVFVLNAIATIVFVLVLHRMKAPMAGLKDQPVGNFLIEIVEGFRYVASNRGMRRMLLLLLAGGIFVRAIAEMLPAFAAGFSGPAATGLAVLTSSMAFGSVTAGLTMNLYIVPSKLPIQVTMAWLLAALTAIAFALSHSLWLMALFAAAMGYLSSVSLVATQTYIQLAAPAGLRGRALSIHGLIFRASPSLGAMILGFTSDVFGLTMPVLASAAVMIAIVGLIGLSSCSSK